MDRPRRPRRRRRPNPSNCACSQTLSNNLKENLLQFGTLVFYYISVAVFVATLCIFLDYRARVNSSKDELNKMKKKFETVWHKFIIVSDNYEKLEMKVARVADELPKIGSQIEMLETLASNIDRSRGDYYSNYYWNENIKPLEVSCLSDIQTTQTSDTKCIAFDVAIETNNDSRWSQTNIDLHKVNKTRSLPTNIKI